MSEHSCWISDGGGHQELLPQLHYRGVQVEGRPEDEGDVSSALQSL